MNLSSNFKRNGSHSSGRTVLGRGKRSVKPVKKYYEPKPFNLPSEASTGLDSRSLIPRKGSGWVRPPEPASKPQPKPVPAPAPTTAPQPSRGISPWKKPAIPEPRKQVAPAASLKSAREKRQEADFPSLPVEMQAPIDMKADAKPVQQVEDIDEFGGDWADEGMDQGINFDEEPLPFDFEDGEPNGEVPGEKNGDPSPEENIIQPPVDSKKTEPKNGGGPSWADVEDDLSLPAPSWADDIPALGAEAKTSAPAAMPAPAPQAPKIPSQKEVVQQKKSVFSPPAPATEEKKGADKKDDKVDEEEELTIEEQMKLSRERALQRKKEEKEREEKEARERAARLEEKRRALGIPTSNGDGRGFKVMQRPRQPPAVTPKPAVRPPRQLASTTTKAEPSTGPRQIVRRPLPPAERPDDPRYATRPVGPRTRRSSTSYEARPWSDDAAALATGARPAIPPMRTSVILMPHVQNILQPEWVRPPPPVPKPEPNPETKAVKPAPKSRPKAPSRVAQHGATPPKQSAPLKPPRQPKVVPAPAPPVNAWTKKLIQPSFPVTSAPKVGPVPTIPIASGPASQRKGKAVKNEAESGPASTSASKRAERQKRQRDKGSKRGERKSRYVPVQREDKPTVSSTAVGSEPSKPLTTASAMLKQQPNIGAPGADILKSSRPEMQQPSEAGQQAELKTPIGVSTTPGPVQAGKTAAPTGGLTGAAAPRLTGILSWEKPVDATGAAAVNNASAGAIERPSGDRFAGWPAQRIMPTAFSAFPINAHHQIIKPGVPGPKLLSTGPALYQRNDNWAPPQPSQQPHPPTGNLKTQPGGPNAKPSVGVGPEVKNAPNAALGVGASASTANRQPGENSGWAQIAAQQQQQGQQAQPQNWHAMHAIFTPATTQFQPARAFSQGGALQMNPQIAGQMRYGFLPHWSVGIPQLPAQPAGNNASVGAASSGPMKSGKAPAAPAANAPGATYIHTNLVPSNLKFPATLIFSQPTGLQMMTQVNQSNGGAPGRPGDNNAPQPQVIGGPFMASRTNVFQTQGGPRVSVITVPQQHQQQETQGPAGGAQPQHANPKALQQTVDQKLRAVSKPAPVQAIGTNARRQPRRGAAPGSDTTNAAPGRQPRGPLARGTTADLTGASRLLATGLATRPATTIGFNNGKAETKGGRHGSQPSGQVMRTAPQRQTTSRKPHRPRPKGPSRRGRGGRGSSGGIGRGSNNGGGHASKNGGKSASSRPNRAKKSRWQVKAPAAAAPGPSS